MEFTTLIKKSCGHRGLVKTKFPQSTISCSQCALQEKDLDKVFVQILKKKFIPAKDVPCLDFNEMDVWIKQKLEEK